MAGESSQTIDRIQVEINFNSATAEQELNALGSKVDATKGKLNSLETSAKSSSGGVSTLGSSASTAKLEFDKYNKTLQTADKTFSMFSKYTKNITIEFQNVGKAAEDASTDIDWIGDSMSDAGKDIDWIPEAASQMGEMAKQTESLGDKAKKAQAMIGALKGGLAGLGITAGITAVINKLKEMYEYAKKAREEYEKTKTELISYTGALDESQEAMVNEIYVRKGENTGFIDKTQVTKAVASTSTLFEGTDTQIKDIATKFSTFQALGSISDTASYAATAKGAFSEWSISVADTSSKLEYLYSVSKASGLDLNDLTNILKDNSAELQKMGYSFEEAAQLAGNTFKSFGDTSKLTDTLSSLDSEAEIKLEELKNTWMENHGGVEVPASVEADLKEQADNWAITQAKQYENTLTAKIDEALTKVWSSAKAWETTAVNDSTVRNKLKENADKVKEAESPSNGMGLQDAYANEVERIRDELATKYGVEDAYSIFNMEVAKYAQMLNSYNPYGLPGAGEGMSLDEVLAQIAIDRGGNTTKTESDTDFGEETEKAADGLNDLGKAAEEAQKPVQEFTENASNPLVESTGTLATNTETVLTNNQTYIENLPTLQESLGNETTAVNNLALGYERLAAAKKAAAEA